MTELKIENVINEKLFGESQKNALNFISFLHSKNIQLTANGEDGQGWAIGGIVGDSLGFLMINGEKNMPGPWTFWFNSCIFNENDEINEELKETAWTHASKCGRCHDGWETCGNGDRIIFGKTFESLCHSPLMFTDPDAKTLENMQKLMLIVK